MRPPLVVRRRRDVAVGVGVVAGWGSRVIDNLGDFVGGSLCCMWKCVHACMCCMYTCERVSCQRAHVRVCVCVLTGAAAGGSCEQK